MIAMCNKINSLLHVNASTPWLHQHCSPAFLQLAQRFEIKASSTCPKCLFSHLQISPCCLAETAWLHLKTCRTTDPKIWKFKWGETTTTWFCEEFLCSFFENLLLQSSHLKLIEIPTCLSRSGQYIFHTLTCSTLHSQEMQDGMQNWSLEWEHQEKHQHLPDKTCTNTPSEKACGLNHNLFRGARNIAQTSLRPKPKSNSLQTHLALDKHRNMLALCLIWKLKRRTQQGKEKSGAARKRGADLCFCAASRWTA